MTKRKQTTLSDSTFVEYLFNLFKVQGTFCRVPTSLLRKCLGCKSIFDCVERIKCVIFRLYQLSPISVKSHWWNTWHVRVYIFDNYNSTKLSIISPFEWLGRLQHLVNWVRNEKMKNLWVNISFEWIVNIAWYECFFFRSQIRYGISSLWPHPIQSVRKQHHMQRWNSWFEYFSSTKACVLCIWIWCFHFQWGYLQFSLGLYTAKWNNRSTFSRTWISWSFSRCSSYWTHSQSYFYRFSECEHIHDVHKFNGDSTGWFCFCDEFDWTGLEQKQNKSDQSECVFNRCEDHGIIAESERFECKWRYSFSIA